jgi:hypothetical protein
VIKAYYDKKSSQEKKQYVVELKHYDLDGADSPKAIAALVEGAAAKKE